MYCRIKELRKINKLTQKELAEKSNIGYRTISDYERGVSTPDADALKNLARVFDVSTDYLLGTTDTRGSFGQGLKVPTTKITQEAMDMFLVMDDSEANEVLNFMRYVRSKKEIK